jgi:GPH family glycoside/pentoside/hexuronide:cation symporter
MESQKSDYSFWKAFRYSIVMIPENSAYQTFTFLVFTFYYGVLGQNVWFVSIGFIIWAIWNAFNDPIMGYFSDRTKSRPKVGRRKIWVIIAFIPLAAIMILLFTPPSNDPWTYVYFIAIICIFELVYTTYSLNQISMFPEIFLKQEDRVKANNVRQIISIVGLIIAFVLPTFIVGDLLNVMNRHKFVWVGYISAGIIIVITTIFLFVVPKERTEFSSDYKSNPGLIASLKFS